MMKKQLEVAKMRPMISSFLQDSNDGKNRLVQLFLNKFTEGGVLVQERFIIKNR